VSVSAIVHPKFILNSRKRRPLFKGPEQFIQVVAARRAQFKSEYFSQVRCDARSDFRHFNLEAKQFFQ
jgi:hypothetical protein